MKNNARIAAFVHSVSQKCLKKRSKRSNVPQNVLMKTTVYLPKIKPSHCYINRKKNYGSLNHRQRDWDNEALLPFSVFPLHSGPHLSEWGQLQFCTQPDSLKNETCQLDMS